MQLAVIDDALYHSLMVVHVLMAVVWIGGGLMLTLQAERSRQTHNEADLVKTAISADFWATGSSSRRRWCSSCAGSGW